MDVCDTKAGTAKGERFVIPSATWAENVYRLMLRILEFENKVYESFLTGLVQGTTHLCQGQEAVAVGRITALCADDYLTYTYRGHGTYIARGMSLVSAFAEIFGRSTGVSAGLVVRCI